MSPMTNHTAPDVPAPSLSSVGMKRYADGKVRVRVTGDAAWASQAYAALSRGMTTQVHLVPDRFADVMREAGAPEDVIAQFIASFEVVDDDIWLGRPE